MTSPEAKSSERYVELFSLFSEKTIVGALAYVLCHSLKAPGIKRDIIDSFSEDARRLGSILLNEESARTTKDIDKKALTILTNLTQLDYTWSLKERAKGLNDDDENQLDESLAELIESIREKLRDLKITIAAWRLYGAKIPKEVENTVRSIEDWVGSYTPPKT